MINLYHLNTTPLHVINLPVFSLLCVFHLFVYLISMLLKFVYQNFHQCFRDRTNSNHNGRLITNMGYLSYYLSYHKMALDQRPVHQMD